MTAIIRFVPLYGADDGPLCYLLELDDTRVLLDCGWDYTFDVRTLEPLARVAPTIDVVLVSHPDLAHCGALPYAMAKLGLRATIYGTIPTHRMGQLFLYDHHQLKSAVEDFELFSLDDVDAAFDAWTQLKYQQHISHQKGEGSAVDITPFPSGHAIGGTVWRVSKETELIVYAPDYTQKNSRVLAGTTLETITRPSLLITGATHARGAAPTSKARDAELIAQVIETLRGNGNVLIPVDTAGRVLEVALLLDQFWTRHELRQYGLALLNSVSYHTIEFAKSQLEWMSPAIVRAFDNTRENPFAFKHMRLCHSLDDTRKLTAPCVILAATPSLEYGHARRLFAEIVGDSRSRVIFVQRGERGSLGERMFDEVTADAAKLRGTQLSLTMRRRVELQGAELEEHRRRERAEKEEEDRRRREEERRKKQQEEEEQADDDDDDEVDVAALLAQKQSFFSETCNDFVLTYPGVNATREMQHAAVTPSLVVMYPTAMRKARWDEYGEVLTAADFPDAPDYEDLMKNDGVADAALAEIDMDAVLAAAPTKCVAENVTVPLNCRLSSVDFDGRSDARDLRNLVKLVQPRKLIIVHGTAESRRTLATFAEKQMRSFCAFAATPAAGQLVNVTSDTNIFKVKLRDQFIDSLNFVRVGDYEIAYMDAQVSAPQEDDDEERRRSAQLAGAPVLDTLDERRVPGHNAIYLGDVKLSEFKQVLSRAGFRVQWAAGGGVLSVEKGLLTLRKEDIGGGRSTIKIEGSVCDNYFRVRDLLYKQYAVV